jgi:hypothetical protein
MRRSERVIEFQSGECGCFGFGETFPSRNRASCALYEVSVRQTGVDQSICRVAVNRLLKIGEAALQIWHIALIPVITAANG